MVISALSYAFTHFKIRSRSAENKKQSSRIQHTNLTSSNAKKNFQSFSQKKKDTSHYSSFTDFGFEKLQQEHQKFYLTLYLINQTNLGYFQRKKQEKLKGRNFSLQRYQRFQIVYEKPKSEKLIKFADKKISHTHSCFNKNNMLKVKNKQSCSPQKQTKSKFQFIGKVVLIEKINDYFACQNDTQGLPIVHYARSAQIELLSFTLQMSKEQQQDVISTLNFHINYKEILNLKAMKSNQFTLQLFFQPYQQMDQCFLDKGQIFINICNLYDFVKKINTQKVFHTQMLIFCQKSKQIKVKQFRYDFLTNPQEYQMHSKLVYQQHFKLQPSEKDKIDYFKQKYYNIGIIMYQLAFGRCLFDLGSVQQIFQAKIDLKEVPFPKYITKNNEESFKDFLNMCIALKFKDQESLLKHCWVQSFAQLK